MGKATEHLIEPGVKPEYLNDSRIGRVLDQLYKKGLTSVFMEISLAALGKTPWISRVSATIAEAQWLMQTLPPAMFAISHNDNYSIAEVCSTHTGVRQRWLIVQSKSRQQADLKQLDKRIESAKTKQAKALQDLSAHSFACETDALDAAKFLAKKLKYNRLTDIEVQLKPHYDKPGRPRKRESPQRYTYHLQAILVLDEAAVALRVSSSKFGINCT